METKLTFKPVVLNTGTNDLYFYEGENVFKNIRTEKSGTVDDETARKVFKISVEATQMINEYPVIETMIKQLNLKFDVGSLQVQK